MVKDVESLRQEVARLAPLEALTGDLQRECSRLHDTSDMCAHAYLLLSQWGVGPISSCVSRMMTGILPNRQYSSVACNAHYNWFYFIHNKPTAA